MQKIHSFVLVCGVFLLLLAGVFLLQNHSKQAQVEKILVNIYTGTSTITEEIYDNPALFETYIQKNYGDWFTETALKQAIANRILPRGEVEILINNLEKISCEHIKVIPTKNKYEYDYTLLLQSIHQNEAITKTSLEGVIRFNASMQIEYLQLFSINNQLS